MWTRRILSCALLLLAACPARQNVQCSENGHCDLGPGGTCLAVSNGDQWCAYPDSSCPSGFRFSTLDVGDGVSGACVGEDSIVTDGGVDAEVPSSWAKQIPGPGFESVGGVAIAPDGSVYFVGSFDQTIDIGGGPLVAIGSADLLLAKFTADGMHVFSRRFGNGGAQAGGAKIKVLSNGDIVVGGNFRGSLTLGGTTLNSAGDQDAFVARFSNGGDPIWARSGGTSAFDELLDLSVDANDNIAVCGSFTGSGTFFGSATLTGSNDDYLVRLTGAGAHSWSRAMNAGGIDVNCGVASMDNGDVVYVANFNGTVNAGGNTLTSTASSLDFFLVRYAASNGAHVWSASKGGTGNDFALDVEASGASIVVTGGFSGSVNLGGNVLTSVGGDDTFVAKFDAANGNHQFSTRFGGTTTDKGEHISVRADGQITVAGSFAGTSNFGGTSITSNGDIDPFVVDLDGTSGAVVSVKSVGGINRDEANDVASSADSLVFAGSFSGSITVLGLPFTSMGALDGYVVRFKR